MFYHSESATFPGKESMSLFVNSASNTGKAYAVEFVLKLTHEDPTVTYNDTVFDTDYVAAQLSFAAQVKALAPAPHASPPLSPRGLAPAPLSPRGLAPAPSLSLARLTLATKPSNSIAFLYAFCALPCSARDSRHATGSGRGQGYWQGGAPGHVRG